MTSILKEIKEGELTENLRFQKWQSRRQRTEIQSLVSLLKTQLTNLVWAFRWPPKKWHIKSTIWRAQTTKKTERFILNIIRCLGPHHKSKMNLSLHICHRWGRIGSIRCLESTQCRKLRGGTQDQMTMTLFQGKRRLHHIRRINQQMDQSVNSIKTQNSSSSWRIFSSSSNQMNRPRRPTSPTEMATLPGTTSITIFRTFESDTNSTNSSNSKEADHTLWNGHKQHNSKEINHISRLHSGKVNACGLSPSLGLLLRRLKHDWLGRLSTLKHIQLHRNVMLLNRQQSTMWQQRITCRRSRKIKSIS